VKKPQQATPEDLLEFSVSVIELYFRIEAVTQAAAGFASAGGEWGCLRTLIKEGPMTVPEMARTRPISRQHCQTMCNALEAQGLVEFVDNPKHKRSKLVRPTKKGRARFESMRKQFAVLHDWRTKRRHRCLSPRARHDPSLEKADGVIGRSRTRAIVGLLEHPRHAARHAAAIRVLRPRIDNTELQCASARKPEFAPLDTRERWIVAGARRLAVKSGFSGRRRDAPRCVSIMAAMIVSVHRAKTGAAGKPKTRYGQKQGPRFHYSISQSISPRNSSGTCEQSALCKAA
jgi:DNA-binding MarR family transcriptional regulator